ncbi:MAG: TIGR03118 family protein [Ferruginibacter sp.]
MKKKLQLKRLILPFFFVGIIISCTKSINENSNAAVLLSAQAAGNAQMLKDFTQTNLVGSDATYNPLRVDPLLVNAWGISFGATGTFWISATNTGVSTVYTREGVQALPAVAIPSPGTASGGHPTGQVFNASPDFKLLNNNPARFIFAGVNGVISGWNGGTAAVRMINRAGLSVYTGLAIGNDGTGNFLYAADFKSGKIDVFNKDWALVHRSFADPEIPAGYAPFNIQAVSGKLYVMYAEVGADGDEEKHPGAGYVAVFNMDGSLNHHLISRGQLNAPWGVAKAGPGFYGTGSGPDSTILVGNFGDGHINAFSENGNFLGQLRAHGNPVVIEGLWAITFPPSTSTIDPNRLYFAAGPDDETKGLFGYIKK